MSADNYIVIFKDTDGRFRGYMGFASAPYANDETMRLMTGPSVFDVADEDEATEAAKNIYTEYGFRFADSLCGDARHPHDNPHYKLWEALDFYAYGGAEAIAADAGKIARDTINELRKGQ